MWFYSPILIPIVAIIVPIIAILANAFTRTQTERFRTEQRRDMLARGIPLDQIDSSLARQQQAAPADSPRRPSSPTRVAGYIRLTAIICIFSGISLIAFFCVLALVLHQTQIYAGAAIGIIPFGVGLGFWIDYRARMREIARMREEGQL